MIARRLLLRVRTLFLSRRLNRLHYGVRQPAAPALHPLIARARKVLAELHSRARREHVPAFTFVGVRDGLGDRDRAFAALQAAIDERSWFVTWLRVDPLLDPLRDDPRFGKLVQM